MVFDIHGKKSSSEQKYIEKKKLINRSDHLDILELFYDFEVSGNLQFTWRDLESTLLEILINLRTTVNKKQSWAKDVIDLKDRI